MNHHNSQSTQPPGSHLLINPEDTLAFSFDDQVFEGFSGDTIASALARSGVHILSRSFKYHRPRGLMCCSGHCPNCLVQVDDEPNVKACMTRLHPGMEVKSQNAWPSLRRDAMAPIRILARFLPVGFYYKTFMWPRFLWPWYERLLRHAAGLGVVSKTVTADSYRKNHLHCDVLVVGAGISGMKAALAAKSAGAQVIVCDENPILGGRRRYLDPDLETRRTLVRQLEASPDLMLLTNTAVWGAWEDNWLAASQGHTLHKIRTRSVIYATGTYERPLIFRNNDLPGVMLGGGVLRLFNLYGVTTGQEFVIITNNDLGWQVASQLVEAGLRVRAIVDSRDSENVPSSALIMERRVRVYCEHTIVAAEGRGRVRKVTIAPLSDQKRTQSLACDVIVVCGGETPANGLLVQAGASYRFDEASQQFLLQQTPPGVFATGRVTGFDNDDPQLAGTRAAAYALTTDQQSYVTGNDPIMASSALPLPNSRQGFLCFCEDVTIKDIDTAIAEGYDSLELLKRYSTISMGPCQGKMCSTNAILTCAQAVHRSPALLGTLTSRPPLTSVPLGLLAGEKLEPVRRTPMDTWHRQQGAKMMCAGLWMRPDHYGDPITEVMNVRRGVGIIDVSTLGKIWVKGPGSLAFLNRYYVNEWQNLPSGRLRYGIACNDEGIILDDGIIAHLSDNTWYVTTTSAAAEGIYENMQWWKQSGWGNGVHMSHVTGSYAAFNLAGPKSRQVLSALVDVDISNQHFPYLHARQLEVAGVLCLVMRTGFTGELSYELHCPAAHANYLWQACLDAGRGHGIAPFGVEAQRILRLEKGHIIVGQDTDATTDPIAADLSWAVNLGKSDFLGKRSLLRIHRESPTRRLVGFTMAPGDPCPEEGLQIVQHSPDAHADIIGWVTSSRLSPTLGQGIGLCWLPPKLASQPGASFTISREGKLLTGMVHHGPFYDPEGIRQRL